jgi:hypothetical protein
VKIREDDLIYIRTTRTGDNKQTETYSIQPQVSKTFTPQLSVSQRYELSADYTFYTYDSASNFLIRTFGVNTTVDWTIIRNVKLKLTHKLRSQDEGSYVEDSAGVERYGKNSEREDNSLGLEFGYKLFGFVNLSLSQTLSLQKKWKIDDGERELSWDRYDTTLTGSASADYELPSGAKVRFNVGRTNRDATNILDRQREVWDISLNVDKTF